LGPSVLCSCREIEALDLDVIAQEIVDDLEAALEQFREIVGDLGSRGAVKAAEGRS
jgi:hypothetical protein